MPFVCNYYVTLRCNARCSFCAIPARHREAPAEPTLEQLAANLRDLRRLGVRAIDFTGGEPLLYPLLPQALDLAKRLGFFTTVTTNGLLYPQLAEALSGKIGSLLFSVESPSAAVHDRIRGVKSFAKVMEAIELARRHNPVVYLSHVVTNESMPRLGEMIRFAQDLRAILYLNPVFAYFGNEGLSRENALLLMACFEHPSLLVDRAQLKLIVAGGNDPAQPVCRAVSSTVVIAPDNRLLLPCYHFTNASVPIERGLLAAWGSEQVAEARRWQGRHEFCRGCTIYCYLRTSLYRKFPLDSVRMSVHYVRERLRHQLPEFWRMGSSAQR